MTTGEQLCLACGMCCDGTLFDNVRLAPSEDPARFKEMGLPVKQSRAKKPVSFFNQPCSALCSDLACRVYQERPAQCRSFECQVFKNLEQGKLSLEEALKPVKQARRMAEQVRRLLAKLGEMEGRLSLSKRFRRVQRRLDSEGLDASEGEAYGKLGLAMHQLDLLAHRKFYTMEE